MAGGHDVLLYYQLTRCARVAKDDCQLRTLMTVFTLQQHQHRIDVEWVGGSLQQFFKQIANHNGVHFTIHIQSHANGSHLNGKAKGIYFDGPRIYI